MKASVITIQNCRLHLILSLVAFSLSELYKTTLLCIHSTTPTQWCTTFLKPLQSKKILTCNFVNELSSSAFEYAHQLLRDLPSGKNFAGIGCHTRETLRCRPQECLPRIPDFAAQIDLVTIDAYHIWRRKDFQTRRFGPCLKRRYFEKDINGRRWDLACAVRGRVKKIVCAIRFIRHFQNTSVSCWKVIRLATADAIRIYLLFSSRALCLLVGLTFGTAFLYSFLLLPPKGQ